MDGTRVGKSEFDAKNLVNETLSVPAVFYNIESWTKLRKSDVMKLKSIQGRLIRGLFGLPKTTPYWGILYELRILPITLLLTYKKLMLYHNLINSDDDRIGKIIVEAQENSGLDGCWFYEVKMEAEEVGIELKKDQVKGKMKSRWKREVKKKIWGAAEKEMEGMKRTSTKLS